MLPWAGIPDCDALHLFPRCPVQEKTVDSAGIHPVREHISIFTPVASFLRRTFFALHALMHPLTNLFSPFRECGRRGNPAARRMTRRVSNPSDIPASRSVPPGIRSESVFPYAACRLPVCRCDTLPHLGLRCGFQATAWARLSPRNTRGDTIQRRSHRACIDAM